MYSLGCSLTHFAMFIAIQWVDYADIELAKKQDLLYIAEINKFNNANSIKKFMKKDSFFTLPSWVFSTEPEMTNDAPFLQENLKHRFDFFELEATYLCELLLYLKIFHATTFLVCLA